jgi:hypothetical protein
MEQPITLLPLNSLNSAPILASKTVPPSHNMINRDPLGGFCSKNYSMRLSDA